jgi:metallo-beta-lactamase family protein
MEIEFVGAAQTVTGSKHLVHTKAGTILLDCGLFQGRRRESIQKNKELGLDPRAIDAVILSHAHIDHSGGLPQLAKAGYDGPIYATPATRDLCAVMLADAAMIQASDARYINKVIVRDGAPMDKVEPLYDEADVVRVLSQMLSIPYQKKQMVLPGVWLTFLDAGHVLGSAVTVLDVEEDGTNKRLVFTGDLGRRRMPILKDPEVPRGTQTLITESTYGDRRHKPIDQMDDELATLLKRVYDRGGKVIIPSFALERAQEILYSLHGLLRQGRLPPMPIYVDSPLTVKITDIFRMHPECFDPETRLMLTGTNSPFDFAGVSYVADIEASKAIDASPDPAIIISASGMCEAGRVVHHLKATIEDAANMIVIVGFQAQHTLGRRLVERRMQVKIFGMEHERRAEVAVLNGFSAHADQADLVAYAETARETGEVTNIALVHGEPGPQNVLKGLLESKGFPAVHVPATGTRLVV